MFKNCFFILAFSILIISCSKEETKPEGEDIPLIFSTLISEKDTIQSGETTQIIATASGYNISYFWSASLGDILGNGQKITYAASPCQAGTNLITCTVKDGNNHEETKEIEIVVL